MKRDIIECNVAGEPIEGGGWWKWNEICDCCGSATIDHSIVTTEKPDREEADFCVDCMRKFIDNKIPYAVAAKQYKKHSGDNQ